MSRINLDRATRLQFALVEEMETLGAETLESIRTLATESARLKAVTGDSRKNAETVGSGIWPLVLVIASTIEQSEAAKELDARQLGDVFSTVLLDGMKGHKPAMETIKAYTSTGKKAIAAVKAGAKNWHQLESKLVKKDADSTEMVESAVSHEEVRDLLTSGDQKALNAKAKTIVSGINALRGRENDVRSTGARMTILDEIAELVTKHTTALKNDRENAKKQSEAAKAADGLRQQRPNEPMTTEVAADTREARAA